MCFAASSTFLVSAHYLSKGNILLYSMKEIIVLKIDSMFYFLYFKVSKFLNALSDTFAISATDLSIVFECIFSSSNPD